MQAMSAERAKRLGLNERLAEAAMNPALKLNALIAFTERSIPGESQNAKLARLSQVGSLLGTDSVCSR